MTEPGLARIALILLAVAGPAAAQPARGWTAEKCDRYARAWPEALARFGTQGLGAAFLDGHARFLASGCRAPRDLCPHTPAELAIADAMTIAAMNAGAASTFLPFTCRG